MRRQPHLPSAAEVARFVAEHLLVVGLLFAGLVAGAWMRDPTVPGLLDWSAWTAPDVGDRVQSFVVRLERFRPRLPDYLAWHAFAALVLQSVMALQGLYDRRPVRRLRNLVFRLGRAAVVAGVAVAVVFFVVRPPELGRTALVIGYALSILGIAAARTAARGVGRARPERVLVLGTGPLASAAQAAATEVDPERYRFLGRAGDEGDAGSGSGTLKWLADWSGVRDLVERHVPDRVLIASPLPPEVELDTLVDARLAGATVATARDFAESLTGRVLEDELGVEFLTEATARPYGRISRVVDLLLAAVLLAVLSPALVVLALLIRIVDGAPVLFRQRRVGRGGRTFTHVKFRTMRADSEDAGPSWSPEGDPRVTRLGGFLRRWRLDELPNLWNVLVGDMAFIGPRPEQPFFVESLREEMPSYTLRHVVRPGVTGWAQVRHPYGSTREDARGKLRYDLYYIKHRSPALDLAILLNTIRVVLRGQGR